MMQNEENRELVQMGVDSVTMRKEENRKLVQMGVDSVTMRKEENRELLQMGNCQKWRRLNMRLQTQYKTGIRLCILLERLTT